VIFSAARLKKQILKFLSTVNKPSLRESKISEGRFSEMDIYQFVSICETHGTNCSKLNWSYFNFN
jgi:hypothetical protein